MWLACFAKLDLKFYLEVSQSWKTRKHKPGIFDDYQCRKKRSPVLALAALRGRGWGEGGFFLKKKVGWFSFCIMASAKNPMAMLILQRVGSLMWLFKKSFNDDTYLLWEIEYIKSCSLTVFRTSRSGPSIFENFPRKHQWQNPFFCEIAGWQFRTDILH